MLIVVGIFILCLTGYLGYENYSFQQHAKHAEGSITDLRYSRSSNSSSGVWYPEITFTDENGQQQTFESSVGSSGYRNSMGKSVDVIYESGDVENAKINDVMGLYLGAIVCGIFAVVFLAIGGIALCVLGRGRKNIRLMQEGKPLSAQIVTIELNDAIQINGRSPWRIVCQWLNLQTNEVHIFNSANIYYDPSPYIKDDKIMVYVANNNFKKYHVDISMLPKKA
jgi:hypothetical protein